MIKEISQTEAQTYQIASNLVKGFKGGEIIALEGDLGAGKTTLTKGISKAFGIKKHLNYYLSQLAY